MIKNSISFLYSKNTLISKSVHLSIKDSVLKPSFTSPMIKGHWTRPVRVPIQDHLLQTVMTLCEAR